MHRTILDDGTGISYSDAEMLAVARYQKRTLWPFVLCMMGDFAFLSRIHGVAWLVFLLIAGKAALIYRYMRVLKYPPQRQWLFALAGLIPSFGLVVLWILDEGVTSLLRWAGFQVGFMGAVLPAKPPENQSPATLHR